MSTTDQEKNIGPGDIAKPGTTNGPGFSLSKTEWLSIQTYVNDALALPTDKTSFAKSLGPGAPTDLSDFDQLIDCYKNISSHCLTWKQTTYPLTVSLASNIYDYGTNKVPLYYGAILPLANKLSENPNDTQSKEALKGVLQTLTTAASGYQAHASHVASEVQKFADETQADKTVLSGTDGKSGLIKYYNDKFGSKSAEVVELNKEIVAQRLVLSSKNAEYDHDVIVAATTPTYAWIFPVGTIAAAVVAGVYGHKAVEALDAARAAQSKINSLSDEIAADAKLMTSIFLSEQGMHTIESDLAEALPVIQKIEGVWGAISADLAAIVKMIDEDIAKALPIIMNLGVEEAIRAWHNVALAANTYRINAYITVG